MNTARFVLAGLAAMMVLVGDCAELEARCRIFARRCRPVCPRPHVYRPMESAPTDIKYCAVYYGGWTGSLHMYYGMPNCGMGDPRPLYFTQPPPIPPCGSNEDFCETYSVEKDNSGCAQGYGPDDPVPPYHVAAEVGPAVVNGNFKYGDGRIKLKLYRFNPRILSRPNQQIGVGYEPKADDPGPFPDRNQELIIDHGYCGHLYIGSIRYDVILTHSE